MHSKQAKIFQTQLCSIFLAAMLPSWCIKELIFALKNWLKHTYMRLQLENFFLGTQPPDPQWEEIPSHTLPHQPLLTPFYFSQFKY